MLDWPMSSPQKTTMFVRLVPAAGFCCACAPHARQRPTMSKSSFFMIVPSLFERENFLPVGLHADDDPVLGFRFVPCLVELADVRVAVVGELALGVVVMHDQRQVAPFAGSGDLQHLQVAVGIAEG